MAARATWELSQKSLKVANAATVKAKLCYTHLMT